MVWDGLVQNSSLIHLKIALQYQNPHRNKQAFVSVSEFVSDTHATLKCMCFLCGF